MSPVTSEMIQKWLTQIEDEHLEFKEVPNGSGFDDLGKYCSALSNAGGGYLVLGMTDKPPRTVTGTQALTQQTLAVAKNHLLDQLRIITVEAEMVTYDNKQLVVFSVPPHPRGEAVWFHNSVYTRIGSSCRTMPTDKLREIMMETMIDYSDTEEPDSVPSRDVDPVALDVFRRSWMAKSRMTNLGEKSLEQLLHDAELLRHEHLTKAGIILLGTQEAASMFVPNAEIILEYRAQDSQIEYDDRISFRQGMFACLDAILEWLERRNSVQHFQDGLFVQDIKTFDDRSIREVIMNAIAHRDYRLPGSVVVQQYPSRLVVSSPGGLPAGVTPENILNETVPRNRRLAENLERTGLVERSGQGFDMMYRQALTQGKAQPDLGGTDAWRVQVTLAGKVINEVLLVFLQRLEDFQREHLSLDDLMLLSVLSQDHTVPEALKDRVPALQAAGLVEVVGRGRGTKTILSRRLYAGIGQPGTYTRKRGLDKEENKALLLKHVRESRRGAVIQELEQVLPDKTRPQIHALLHELAIEGKIVYVGSKRTGKWHTT